MYRKVLYAYGVVEDVVQRLPYQFHVDLGGVPQSDVSFDIDATFSFLLVEVETAEVGEGGREERG